MVFSVSPSRSVVLITCIAIISADMYNQDVSQQHVPTFIQALSQAKLISSAIVSYKLPRLADGQTNTGELTLGALDPHHYYPKSLVTVKNVNKFGFWGAAVDAVMVGAQNMGWSNRTVVMDTGTVSGLCFMLRVYLIHFLCRR